MSILSWLLKSKKEMAKPNTKNVRIGKYNITSHAQNRIVDKERRIKKNDIIRNLFGNSYQTKPYLYKGEYQYDKIHVKTKTVTHITPEHRVKTYSSCAQPQKRNYK
jgi:hypothetical protein